MKIFNLSLKHYLILLMPLLLVDCSCDNDNPPATLPQVSIVGDVESLEGFSVATNNKLVFTVQLSAQADGQVDITYATADGTATTADSDYTAANGMVSIPATMTTATVEVTITGDSVHETNETLTLTLSNVSANATLGTATRTGTITNDDLGGTNDTNVSQCFTNAVMSGGVCPQPSGNFPEQDGDRGSTVMNFQLINSTGAPDPFGTACVLDNTTGLMWELKQSSGIHQSDRTFTWFDSNAATNGGDAGTPNGGACATPGNCDTEKYVAEVNAATWCSFNDWRMPTADELRSIVDYASTNATAPALGFTDTTPGALQTFWASETVSTTPANAWTVEYVDGKDQGYTKSNNHPVRLVRP